MSSNYLPTRDVELRDWSQNLAGKLLATPLDYGVTDEIAMEYDGLQGDYAGALAVILNPDTRTRPAIATKNDTKAALVAATRPLVQTIQSWSGMTDAKRDQLQIPVRDYDPTPVPPPAEMPRLAIGVMTGRVLDLEVRNLENKRPKPEGVRAVRLYSHLGPNPLDDLKTWRFEGSSTKSDPQIIFDQSVAVGTEVWITAQWVSPTDKPGPACAPIKTHINFEGLNNVAA